MEDIPVQETSEKQYFTVSRFKLSIMYLTTMGLYAVYWFYKNWNLQKPLMDKKISPVWRSIFSIFFTHSLFERIKVSAEQKNITAKYNYGHMATMFVVLIVLANLVGAFEQSNAFGALSIVSLLLFMLGLYPLYVIQNTINNINEDPHGVFNDDLTIINYVFIVLGAVMWFSVLMASLVYFGVLQIQ